VAGMGHWISKFFWKTDKSTQIGREHRITECFGLEGTVRGHLAQAPSSKRVIFHAIFEAAAV